MSASPPPDLRVICRKLTSIPPAQLPHALPSLTNHILRCKEPLSAPQDAKPKDNASESSLLVHKLKTSITTLLNGRSREARFAAVALIKAIVDVGGWEVLRGSGPWVNGLLSIIQKGDPMPSKELAIVTLTRIYMLLHPYQTLVREIATPTIPAFSTACLQLIKRPASGEPTVTPLSVVETICDAISTLIPLYPTTFRPSSSNLKTALKPYVTPTSSDSLWVTESLRKAARKLALAQHQVAAKAGGSDEWAALVKGILKELHATADQVFRAVDESWESSGLYTRGKVELGGEPHGGNSSADFTPWTGINAGADRLIGLFNYLSESLRCTTKAPVNIPTTALIDAVSRVCLIARLSPKSQSWEQSLQTNAAIGREEKEELWSVIPDIHIAAMQLLLAMIQRLRKNMLPNIPELLDHLARVFKSGISIAAVRVTGYFLLDELLLLAGPTLSKPAVDMLDPLLGACCRDLQQNAGYLKQSDKANAIPNDAKKNGMAANADLFLQPQAANIDTTPKLEPSHEAAASKLLSTILTTVPQQHLKPTLRGLLDKTAILTGNRDAMVASVLNPYRDQRGRLYPNILPHLTQQYPNDQALEILRTNLRVSGLQEGGDLPDPADLEEEEEEEEDTEMQEVDENAEAGDPVSANPIKALSIPTATETKVDLPVQSNPFGAVKESKTTASNASESDKHTPLSPPKRKHEGNDLNPPKRQELSKPSPADDSARVAAAAAPQVRAEPVQEAGEEESSDDESVHLNMELEEDEEGDEDEE
ncbi:Pre-rRNA-processing protein rix1 [Paramyrothecium foliicola]|nr:Pre-rRNA-processing protein rix1 [Paramyrothecium foliicola]